MHQLTFNHLTPLSIEETREYFLRPHLLKEWLCDSSEEGDDGIYLQWGQDHYVFWELHDQDTPDRISITQQFMGDSALETVILVELSATENGTQIQITQTGEITPRMEKDYRDDWSGLKYLGFPERKPKPQKWSRW